MPAQSITIPLTKGQAAVIDAEDYERVSQFKWYADGKNGHWRAAHTINEPRTEYLKPGKVSRVLLHRFIMEASPGMVVDHINGDTLDNRRANLRVCSPKENGRNLRLYKSNTSGYKGVSRRGKSWVARVKHDGSHVFVGTFETALEAARAYDAKARELFGEFARPNFPDRT